MTTYGRRTCDNCRTAIEPGDAKFVPIVKGPSDPMENFEVHANLTTCFAALRERIDALENQMDGVE